MNDMPSGQHNLQSSIQEQHLLRKKIGLFTILFIVGTVIFLLILVLNYFSILKLYETFPNHLGWIPHRLIISNLPVSQEINSAQTANYPTDTFQYDTEKAKTIISQYAKETIKPEFLPEILEIRQGLSIDNRLEDFKDQFGSYFTQQETIISVNFHYKENTNIPNDYIIFIQPPNVGKTIVTSDIANSLTLFYFTNPYASISNCVTKGILSYCETFKGEIDGNKGYGVVFTDDKSFSPPKPTLIVFTCFVPKESEDYASRKSCISI